MADTWLDHVHPQYKAWLPRWTLVRDCYTGDVLDPARVKSYLIRKAIGETPEAYQERCDLADYTPHFATVVDSLAGMLFANEADANRVWSTDTVTALGDESDVDSWAGKLTRDADGQGNGWPTVWKQFTGELIQSQIYWVLVDSEDGTPRVRLLPPTAVTNWRYAKVDESKADSPMVLAEVTVVETVDVRTSIQQEAKPETRWVVYRLDGWTRYKKVEQQGGQTAIVEDGKGVYAFTDRHKRPALPLYRIELPLKRYVGWMLAKKAQALFNRESERDHLLRFANFPKLLLDCSSDDVAFAAMVKVLKEGGNVLPGAGHVYIGPDVGPATIATTVIDDKRKDFYIVAFREYGDAARERTATEVRQDVSSGVGAFLLLLKAAVDDAENEAGWRVEQILFPTDQAKWWTFSVTRSDQFLPQDVAVAIERTRKWFFGETAPIPLGRGAQIAAAKQVADYQGIEVDDAEVAAAVDLANLKQATDLLRDLPVPAQAKAMLAIRALEVIGVLKAEDTITMGDGSTQKLRAVLLAEAEALAGAADEAARQMAETFRQAPPGADPNAPPAGGAPLPVAA